MSAVVTLLGSLFDTNSGTHAVTATPAVGDLIVIIRANTGNTTSHAPTDDNSSGTYTKVTSALKASSADLMEVWIRNSLISSAVSTIFTDAAGTTTGGGLAVYKVTGMSVTATNAERQVAVQANHASGSAPAPVFGSVPLTANPIIGAVFNATSPATLTPRTNFTEDLDVGFSTPTAGLETMSRNSGETTTTQTWGSSSASAFCSIVVELDTSTAPIVTTSAASSVATTTATGNGNVTGDGGFTVTERGIVWSTSANPTTANSKQTAAGTTGAFSASMTGLTLGTLYHYRAYATNLAGTSYGADTTFTTNSPPTVALNTPADAGTSSTTRPQLAFTGTDVDSDAISYEIEIDTVNTFDSQAGNATATISLWGGGGGGGGADLSAVAATGGGGGGGAFSQGSLTVASATGYAVTIGAGGSVGAGNNSGSGGATAGGVGGDSSFVNSSTVFAKGGTGGGAGNNSGQGAGGTGGASASGIGTTKTSGGNGAAGDVSGLGGGGGGSGGASTSGGAASGQNGGAAGTGSPAGVAGKTHQSGIQSAATQPGGGGSGGTESQSGAAGGAGKVIITVPLGIVASATGGTHTTDATNDIWTFTASGTWTPTIAVPLLDKLSNTDTGFADITNGAHTDPFVSGEQIGYTVQAGNALTNGTTYYWRARGKDPSGTNTFGAWATTRSFAVTIGGASPTNQFFNFF